MSLRDKDRGGDTPEGGCPSEDHIDGHDFLKVQLLLATDGSVRFHMLSIESKAGIQIEQLPSIDDPLEPVGEDGATSPTTSNTLNDTEMSAIRRSLVDVT